MLEVTLHIPQTIVHILHIAVNIFVITLHFPHTIVHILQIALNILEIALKVHRQTGPSTSQPIYCNVEEHDSLDHQLPEAILSLLKQHEKGLGDLFNTMCPDDFRMSHWRKSSIFGSSWQDK